MPLTGTLRSWNEERGFGFIAPTNGGAEIFVHVSAFARDGTKPSVGEKLSYELDRGRDGKPQAAKVVRIAVGATRPPKVERPTASKSNTSWVGVLVTVAVLAAAGTWGYKQFAASRHRSELASQPATPAAAVPEISTMPTTAFRCDGRTHCSQMTSCAEAKWFINHCPGTKMDGNNDGIPCQEQWCN